MAYNSIYTGPQIDEAVRDGEWYNLRCVPGSGGDAGRFSLSRTIVIENALPKLEGDDYRLVYMRETRDAGKGLQWAIPMFGAIRGSEGAWSLANTYKPVAGNKIAVVYPSSEFLHSWRTKKTNSRIVYYFLLSKNTKQRVGYALFKNTGVGTFGWQRVSNIVGVVAAMGNKRGVTADSAINYATFSE